MEQFYSGNKRNAKLYNNVILAFLFVFFCFFSLKHINAQQVIGVFPEINGSFSHQPDTLDINFPFAVPQVYWTTEELEKGILRESGGRSHRRYLEFTQSGIMYQQLYTPTLGTKLKRNTTYTVQFYMKGDMDSITGGNAAFRITLSPDGLLHKDSTLWVNDNDTTISNWQLLYFTFTTPDVPETEGLVSIDVINDRIIFIDDFVIYPDSFDILPPADVDAFIVNATTLTSIDLSWAIPSTGLDSGGYVLVRYKDNKPEDDDKLNFKGIYNVGDTIVNTNEGIILYIGTDTTYFDDNLEMNTEYSYRVFTVDKAFNYSYGADITTYTLVLFPELTVDEDIEDFGLVEVGDISGEQSYTLWGEHLTGNLVIETTGQFKISQSSGIGFTNIITLTPVNGEIPLTTIYVRYEPIITGLAQGKIVHTTFAVPDIDIDLSGMGYKDEPSLQASDLHCTDVGSRSLNVNWTNGDGDRRMVVMNTVNSFTPPIDSTYPAHNPQYVGTGEQIVYKGASNSFNVYGLTPESSYWFRVYEYNNTDTLTRYLTNVYTLNPAGCSTVKEAQFFEDFELGVLDGYYVDTLISLESGNWRFSQALIGESEQDKKRGGRSARIIKGGYIAMDFNKPKGIETISLYHSNYRLDQNGMLMVQYSTNNGQTFHSLGMVNCNNNGSMEKVTFNLPTPIPGNVRFVINAINGGRINIDDISITDYVRTNWTGYADTVWNNHNNWDNGIPDEEKTVIIPTVPVGNALNFPVISTAGAVANDLKIEGGAKLIINPNASLSVYGEVTALDSLIILSDETGIGSLITHGDYQGKAHIYKYVYGSNRPNFVGVPISNGTSAIFDALQASNKLEYFTESTALWTEITNNTTPLTPAMRGYNFKRNSSGRLLFSGFPNNYNYCLSLSRTVSSPYKGFNLIGNPYPSGIDWNSDSLNTDALVNKTYWINKNESFAAYNGHAKIGCPEDVNNLIAPLESFFVKLDTPQTLYNLCLNNFSRKHNTEAPDTSDFNPHVFRLKVNQQGQFTNDAMAIAFFAPAGDTFDIYDSEKLFALNTNLPQIFTYADNVKTIINSQTPILQYKEIPLGFKTETTANFTFTVNTDEYDINMPVFLEDKLLDSLTDLRTITYYNFSSNVVNDTGRFTLHFYPCYFTEYSFVYDTLYCEGSGGVSIVLNGSETNVEYQLFENGLPFGLPKAGTGTSITWTNMLEGVYTVKAISTIIPACFKFFTDTAFIQEIALPIEFNFAPLNLNTYCEGTTGAEIKLNNSSFDVFYALSKDGVPYGAVVEGDGTAIIWSDLLVGSYSLIAYSNTVPVCSRIFQDTIDLSMIPAPGKFDLICSGTSCEGAGGWVEMQGSELNVNYQLKKDGLDVFYAYTGTGNNILWENIFVSGYYYIVGTSAITDCSIPMNDTVEIYFIHSPSAFNVFGGGTFCQGQGVVGLDSSETDVFYQLIKDNYYNIGPAVPGTNDTIWWTGLNEGSYTVSAYTPTVPICTGNMSNNATIITDHGPNIYNMSSGGSYCDGEPGVNVFLNGSDFGVEYQLYKNGSTWGSPVVGTGSFLSWTNQLEGTYTVIATDINGLLCTALMDGETVIIVNPAPTVYNVSGGSTYCQGSTGATLTLSGSQIGAYYQLYKNSSPHGGAVNGTGSPLQWTNLLNGSYTVSATFDDAPNCSSEMNGILVVAEIVSPSVFNLTGNGSYCAGGAGLIITLSSSQTGVNYQLKKNGVNEGTPLSGTGGSLTWSNMLQGSYTVEAFNDLPPYCSSLMNGTVVISETTSPTVFNLSGGGSYCAGGSLLSLTLSGSQIGVSYQLKKNGISEGFVLSGTGNPMTWNNLGAGTYTIEATHLNPPYCSILMNNNVVITEIANPVAYNLTGSGSYCSGTLGLNIQLSGSELSVNYQLKRYGLNQGAAVTGTGNIITWNNITEGSYTVEATSVDAPYCVAPMSGSVVVTETANPVVYGLSGGGTYCEGVSGLSVALSGSELGVNYQLKKNGISEGGFVAGTGNAISWNNLTAGTYTVDAASANIPYCEVSMTGSVIIEEIPNPTLFNLSGGGAYCVGGSGPSITLSGSQLNVNYQLKKNGANEGAPLAGTGSAIIWNNLTAGVYTVEAVSSIPPYCPLMMNGTVNITTSVNPTVFNLSGGGSYCAGSPGLSVQLSGSQTGVNYQLKKNGADEGGTQAGTGSAISWNNLTAGTYTVEAIVNTSPYCSSMMNGSVVITESSNPVAYILSGGGSYCFGQPGRSLTLSGSQTGVSYQLKKDGLNYGSALNGTGNPLVWNNLLSGSYSVTAVNSLYPYCITLMTGLAVITEEALPIVDAGTDQYILYGTSTTLEVLVSGGSGSYTYQWTPVPMVLSPNTAITQTQNINAITQFIVSVEDVNTTCSKSDTVYVYISGGPLTVNAEAQPTTICVGGQLSLNALVSGGSGSYDFTWSSQPVGFTSQVANPTAYPTVSTTYTVSVDDGYNVETSAVSVNVSPLPVVYLLSGGGSYCTGITGMSISMSGSQTGVMYQLKKGGIAEGSAQSGTGSILTWNNLTAGTYTVSATSSVSPYCTSDMTGSIVITEVSNPTVFTLSGGGSYCAGSTGLSVQLSGSQTGVNYQLKKNGVDQGAAQAGTGSTISWTNQTSGTYTVVATGSTSPYCTATMTGSIDITEISPPTIFTLSGGGSYCAGSTGQSITLSSSESGVNYQLKKNGVDQGTAQQGTGIALSWNNMTSGTYTVEGTLASPPHCAVMMSGSISITELALPTVSLGNDFSIAHGTTTTLSSVVSGGSGSYSYAWTPSSMLTNASVSPTTTHNLYSATEFILLVTDNASPHCAQSDTIVVSVTGSALGVAMNMSSDTICYGDTLYLNATASGGSGNYSYTWSSQPTGFTAAVSDTFALPTVSTTYTVAVNDNFNTTTASRSVYIVPQPQVYVLHSGGLYCYNENGVSLSLSGSEVGISYQLYKDGLASGLPQSGTGSALVWDNQTTGNYEVYAQRTHWPYCSIMMQGVGIVSMHPQTTVVFNTVQHLCADSDIELLTATPLGGTFSGPGVAGQYFNATISGVGLHDVVYTYTDANNCVYNVTQGILVNVLPTVSLQSYADICINTPPFLLTGGNPTGGYFLGNGIENDTLYVDSLGAGTHNITYWYVDGNNCKNSDVQTIKINGFPTGLSLSTPGMYCQGTAGTVITLDTSETGVAYQLYKDGVAYGLPIVGAGASLTWDDLLNGQYHMWGYYASTPSCETFMNNIVNIYESSPPYLYLGNDTTLCYDQEIELAAHVGYDYYWIKLPADTLSTDYNLLVDSAMNGTGTQTYVVVLIDNHNCTNTDSINITFDNCTYVISLESCNILMYPNPSSGIFNIEFTSAKEDNYRIEIQNILGQNVYIEDIDISSQYYKKTINIENYIKGVYLLNIYKKKELIVAKKLIFN